MIKLIAFDLDGTLTQHKEGLISENKAALDKLGKNISFSWSVPVR